MSGTFAGKTALVAGGTGGLGRAVSLAFLEAGAVVGVTYRKPEEFETLRANLKRRKEQTRDRVSTEGDAEANNPPASADEVDHSEPRKPRR